MSNSLRIAIEANEGTEKEIEYGFFLKVTQEQIEYIKSSLVNNVSNKFSESKLPTEDGYYSRLRAYYKDEGTEYELTTKLKYKSEEGGPSINEESNVLLEEMHYKALMQLTTSTIVRERIDIEFRKDGEPIIRSNGEPMKWEVDLYQDGKTGGISEWIKVDLEVDKSLVADVLQFIPFEYEEAIASNDQDPVNRALIDNLYSDVYPVGRA